MARVIGLLIAIVAAAFVYWLVAHVSVLLAVVVAAFVFLIFLGPVGTYGDRWRGPRW